MLMPETKSREEMRAFTRSLQRLNMNAEQLRERQRTQEEEDPSKDNFGPIDILSSIFTSQQNVHSTNVMI
jgi:hypothetical protein